jgi:cell wall-associated NlpC family hydrolase
MKNFLGQHLRRVSAGDARAGDIVYLNFPSGLEHAALLSDGGGMIHCYLEARAVVEHRLDPYWTEKISGFYRYRR